MALLILQTRFSALDPGVVAAIERADAATLEQVVIPAATESLTQVRLRLGLEQ